MTGLGIIDTDLCMWAGSVTPEMFEQALLTSGHPVLKAKPGPVEVESFPSGWLYEFNAWVSDHPFLAAGLIIAGYVLLSGRKV